VKLPPRRLTLLRRTLIRRLKNARTSLTLRKWEHVAALLRPLLPPLVTVVATLPLLPLLSCPPLLLPLPPPVLQQLRKSSTTTSWT